MTLNPPIELRPLGQDGLPLMTGLGPVPEILAPAGGREQFFAALNSGADAVFLGLKQFNARSRAENFTVEELKTLVPMARRYGMKVLVTLNILIKDTELEALISTLTDLEEVGVHAIIVQDLGVASLVRRFFPGLRLHASTQMAVHNLAGVIEAVSYGFKRVVLARELTAEEIRRIRKAVGHDVELEVFCHGSLCYSYSGLCFFSGAKDARSGNRGECAYTCREPYKVISEPGHGFLFSMRDLDTSHKLDQMVRAGVDTLKIEGRKKDAQYVSSVVRLYRKKLDELFGQSTLRADAPPLAREELPDETRLRQDLKLSFQRQTTSFFFEGRYHENVIDLNSPTHFGIRIGTVEKIAGRFAEIRLEDDIEKYDGLKIIAADKIYHSAPQHGSALNGSLRDLDRRYSNHETALGVRGLRFKGRFIVEAHRGMLVEIELPESAREVSPGDIVFKARSADLKRRVERLSGAPVDARLRSLVPVDLRFAALAVSDGGVRISVSVLRSGELIADQTVYVADASVRQKGDLLSDLKDLFHIFGDQGVCAETITLDSDQNWFIPRSLLKELKRAIEEGLGQKVADVSRAHGIEALRSISTGVGSAGDGESESLTLKIDRLEYLAWIGSLAQSGVNVREIVFEPKKMFLPSVKAEDFLDALETFRADAGIAIRLAFPTVIRAWDEPVLRIWFQEAHKRGFRSYEIGNPGAFGLLREWELPRSDLMADFSLYGLNREAVRHWASRGVAAQALSIEDDYENLTSLLTHWPDGVRPVAIAYKDTPLFVAEACSLTALHQGCPTSKVCGYRTLEIENSKGDRFFVAHEGCKSVVYGKQAYALSGSLRKLRDLGVKNFRIDFLTRPYEKDQFTQIIEAVVGDRAIDGTHSANFDGCLK